MDFIRFAIYNSNCIGYRFTFFSNKTNRIEDMENIMETICKNT